MTKCEGPSENEGRRFNDPGNGDYEIKDGVRQWISPSQEMRKRIYKDRIQDAKANRRRVYRRSMR